MVLALLVENTVGILDPSVVVIVRLLSQHQIDLALAHRLLALAV